MWVRSLELFMKTNMLLYKNVNHNVNLFETPKKDSSIEQGHTCQVTCKWYDTFCIIIAIATVSVSVTANFTATVSVITITIIIIIIIIDKPDNSTKLYPHLASDNK